MVAKRRETGKTATIGPLVEVRQKPLIKYGKGVTTDYYELTLPTDFVKLNKKIIGAKERPLVNLYFSPTCRKFLLLSLGQWPTLFRKEGEEAGPVEPLILNLEDIKKAMEDSFPTTATVSYLREEIFAKVEQGVQRIVVQAENIVEFEEALKVVNDVIQDVGPFAHVYRRTMDTSISISIRDNPKEVEQLVKEGVEEFDLKGLTMHMLKEVGLLFSMGIRALESLSRLQAEEKGRGDVISRLKVRASEAIERLKGREAYVDFLWAYNCRQLIRAGRYGLFCGVGPYTSINPVALGSFYKLLEHAVDQIMAILQLASRCVEKGPDSKTNKFLTDVTRHIRNSTENLKMIQEPLLRAIENKLTDEDKRRIAVVLKEFHEKAEPAVGTSGETYLTTQGAARQTPVEAMLEGVSPDKLVLLAQMLPPLQKICKFPANIAMLARILYLPIS